MGKSAFNGVLFVLIWSSVFAQHLQAGTCQEYSKVIKRDFNISKEGTFSLNNKYGNIKVEGWGQQRARVEVSIVVHASSESNAQRVFNRIKVEFSESRDYVSAETQVIQQKKEWWFWGEEEADYSISYKAYVPYNCKLMVQNRHGDVNIENTAGPAALNVQYGNLTADYLKSDSELVIEQGMGIIGKAGRLKVSLQQGRLQVENARLLEIDSRYSQIWIERADEVLCSSKYDTYNLQSVGRFVNKGEFDNIGIETAEEISVTSTLTELFVGRVNKSLRLQVDSSGVKIASIGRSFRDVDISGSFTDFRLGIESGATYQMDAVADFAGIRYPRSLKVTYEREAGTNHEVRGHVGTNKPPRLLRARVSYGALRVGQD